MLKATLAAFACRNIGLNLLVLAGMRWYSNSVRSSFCQTLFHARSYFGGQERAETQLGDAFLCTLQPLLLCALAAVSDKQLAMGAALPDIFPDSVAATATAAPTARAAVLDRACSQCQIDHCLRGSISMLCAQGQPQSCQAGPSSAVASKGPPMQSSLCHYFTSPAPSAW